MDRQAKDGWLTRPVLAGPGVVFVLFEAQGGV